MSDMGETCCALIVGFQCGVCRAWFPSYVRQPAGFRPNPSRFSDWLPRAFWLRRAPAESCGGYRSSRSGQNTKDKRRNGRV